ncbi:Gfo/Idh/MocA family protein [Paenibacillus tarimensis]|uniref:Gfo/Idh/MocA family protein n=1 Tax=Paenibacillus tarimensis TaxID=416012 RepID=UPI001F329B22|nr:Gfo/Idh/MocA family oxidoreductase [Paenibacillus tarimensis]MCF2943633.1 Gfo/Idh/MocA family oxidoreductase [Paenibacillus tarimensis]
MTLRIGIVGTGWFARMHADLLEAREDVRVTGFCGTSLAKAEAAAKPYRYASGYSSLTAMLDDCKPDAVYICVPPFAHGEIEHELIARRVPFLVEKPLGTGDQEPRRIEAAVREAGLLTSVGYHFRYTDAASRARDLLKERIPGMALGYWNGGMPGVGWWRRQEGSGGQFVEQTTHIVDLLRYLLGEVTEVYAAYAQAAMHQIHEGVTVPDVGTVTMKLASGLVATISNTCMLPVDHMTGLHIYTTSGVMELSHHSLKDLEAGRTTEYRNISNPYERENEAFLHAVRTGDRSMILSDYSDALRTQGITAAANESARTGQPVVLHP